MIWGEVGGEEIYASGFDRGARVENPTPALFDPAVAPGGVSKGMGLCEIRTGGLLVCASFRCGNPAVWGSYACAPAMTPANTDTDWAFVYGGEFHTCAIKTSGALFCWGVNDSGQLGDGTMTSHPAPNPVDPAHTWLDVACGDDHTCAVRSDGTLWCWGDNGQGAVGNGTHNPPYVLLPTQVGTDTDWAEVAATLSNSYARKQSGALYGWGAKGFLGDGSGLEQDSPVPIGAASYAQISGSLTFACAVRTDGTLWCWGDNSLGQLGDGTTTNQAVPEQIGTDTSWVEVRLDMNTGCGRKSDGTLWCWGQNDGSTGLPLLWRDQPVTIPLP